MIPSLRGLDWHTFLARPRLPSPSPQDLDSLRNKRVLITGAGGSIGSALSLRLAQLVPQQLIFLDASEERLFALQQSLPDSGLTDQAACVLGSIHDQPLLDELFALHAPQLVLHAAAFKHVPLLEDQPLAAIDNNILGTAGLVSAASAHGARVLLVSTDKAVEPASVLGATKRVAEHIVLASGGTALRLANVLASRGSAAEVFAQQIACGGPITLTGDAARRYFLTIDETVDLALITAAEEQPGAIFAPALDRQYSIRELAQFLIRTLAPHQDIGIEHVASRPGDKVEEKLWSSTESARPARALLAIESPFIPCDELVRGLEALRKTVQERDVSAALAHLCLLVPDFTPSFVARRAADRALARIV